MSSSDILISLIGQKCYNNKELSERSTWSELHSNKQNYLFVRSILNEIPKVIKDIYSSILVAQDDELKAKGNG